MRAPFIRVTIPYAVFALLLLLFNVEISAQTSNVQGAQSLQAHFRGKTRPLRDLAPMPATSHEKRQQKKSNKPIFTPPNFTNWRRQPKVNMDALPLGMDPVRQDNLQHRALSTLVEPAVVIEGIGEDITEVGVPDTNGDVSPEHYFQIVNASWFQIFAKDGTPLIEPTTANTIWNEIGEQSFSDPLVLWDEAAGRWLLTDLADIDVVLYGVSETSDPLGAWNLYTYETPGFADYPKYGVWPDAYIFTVNELGETYPVYALNREQMLAGAATVDVQRIEIPSIDGGFPTATPMDWNSPTPPPTDEMFVVRINDDAWGNGNTQDLLEVWTIDLDWAIPANTTATKLELPTAPYDSDGCSVTGFGFDCIPQPGTDQPIDGIMTIVMHNVAYWNYGTHESAVLTFSVDAGDDVAGVRWMEIRRLPGADWTVYQEGTVAFGDGIHRFIGAIAINERGDIGLGYSVTGPNTFPGLRFTGRQESDPLGEMTVEEYEFAPGAGVREGTERYGDYAKMSADPLNGSFWFTSEYVKADGSYGTKIVNFELRRDTFDIAAVALLSPQNAPLLTTTETVTIRVRNVGLDTANNISVGYIFENQPPVIEPAAISILAPDSVYIHTFATPVDMSTIGSYEFKVFTQFAEDQNVRNDTLFQKRRHLPRFDAGITGVAGLDGILCDSEVTIQPMITNFGTEPLTSATIQYQLNGGTIQTQNWTGIVAPNSSTSFNLNLSGLITGTNTLNISTLNPNGVSDEIATNDAFSRPFQVLLEGTTVTLTLTFDAYPEETSWQLEDESGQIIFSGDGYNGMEEETIIIPWCLEAEKCYTFRIFDSYGDGIFGFGAPDGSYQIKNEDGIVLASIIDLDFGFEEENEFCVAEQCLLEANFSVTPATTTSSNNGIILASVTTGVSPFYYQLNGGPVQLSPLFSGLDVGTYTINITDVNGCTFEDTVSVWSVVATDDVQQDYAITVAPNPSKNGAFALKVTGLTGNYQQLDLQVVDMTGRPVHYTALPAVDGHYAGMISLAKQPAGVYYIRFKNAEINELVRVVRL
jgi:hypothetical protein